LKNKLILSGLFLTSVISCSTFKPIVLNAFLDPESVTPNTGYDDINWSYALFNQYASGLRYKFRLDYSNSLSTLDRERSIAYVDPLGVAFFTDFTTITSTFAEGELNNVWRARVNKVLFNRDFDRVTKFPNLTEYLVLRKFGVNENTFFSIILQSNISYSVNIGSAYFSYNTNSNINITTLENFITFRNRDNVVLQRYRLDNNPASGDNHKLYNLATVTTNVNRFDIQLNWIDIPPYAVSPNNQLLLFEFNLFTQNQEISIPDDVEGDRFGFEFVAVEWWNILGHLQNFAWWIVNQSPVAPIFEWIDDYIITWVSGLITFITGIFRL
jgi:hypothetical protein